MGNILKEKPAAQEEERSPTLGDVGKAFAGAAVGAVEGLPFGKGFVQGASNLIGKPHLSEELHKEVPLATGAGEALTSMGTAAALPEAQGASKVAKVLASGAQNTALGAVYKLGDVTADVLSGRTPLQVEQLTHQLFGEESLQQSLIDFAFGTAAGTTNEVLRAAPKAVQAAAKKFANSEAGKFVKGAAEKLGVDSSVLGKLVLDHHLLDQAGNATKKVRELGDTIEKISNSTKVTPDIVDDITAAIAPHFEQALPVKGLDKARRYVASSVDRLGNLGEDISGEHVAGVIKDLGQQSRAAYKAGKGQLGTFLGDSTQAIRDVFVNHIEALHGAEKAQEYRNAIADYGTFSKIKAGAEKGAQEQVGVHDWLKAAGVSAADAAVGHLVGGNIGGIVGGVYGLKSLGRKSYASLLDRFSKLDIAAPSEWIAKTTESILKGAPHLFRDSETPHDDFDVHEHFLKQVEANPQKAADHIRAKLDFLPGPDADAVTGKVMAHLQNQVAALPKPTLSTMFGPVNETDESTKRRVMDLHRAGLDPYWAVQTGNPELIQAAEKANPATVLAIKNQILEAMGKRKDIPYEARVRIGNLFGQPATPLQDPIIGLALQQSLRQPSSSNTDPGQKGTARNMAAQMKQNKATMTRAQTLQTLGQKQ